MDKSAYTGAALRTRMETCGFSARGLASKLGISHSAVLRWLQGCRPANDLIEPLSRALSVVPPRVAEPIVMAPYPDAAMAMADSFRCVPLNAKLTRRQCVMRQTMELTEGAGMAWTKTPQNLYCQSGQCEVGNWHLDVLVILAPRLQRKTPDAQQAPGAAVLPEGSHSTEGTAANILPKSGG